ALRCEAGHVRRNLHVQVVTLSLAVASPAGLPRAGGSGAGAIASAASNVASPAGLPRAGDGKGTLLRFTEMGDTFPIPTCQSGWYSHQRGDQDGNQTRPQGPGAKAAAWRALAQARIYASRGGTHVRGARQAVSEWAQALEAGGKAALRNKRLGRPPSLETDQRAELVQLLKAGALAQGFATELWTLKRVGELIARRFGVRYSHTGVATARQTGVQRTATEQQGAGARRSGHCRLEEEERWPTLKKTPQRTAA